MSSRRFYKNMRKEILEKAKKAGSVDELIALASGEGIELEREKAERIFSSLKSNELSDDALFSVAGGSGENEVENPYGGACYCYTGPK